VYAMPVYPKRVALPTPGLLFTPHPD